MGWCVSRQERSEVTSKPPAARREAWIRSCLTELRRQQSCPHLDLGLPASPGQWDNTFVLLKPPRLQAFLRQPQEASIPRLRKLTQGQVLRSRAQPGLKASCLSPESSSVPAVPKPKREGDYECGLETKHWCDSTYRGQPPHPGFLWPQFQWNIPAPFHPHAWIPITRILAWHRG